MARLSGWKGIKLKFQTDVLTKIQARWDKEISATDLEQLKRYIAFGEDGGLNQNLLSIARDEINTYFSHVEGQIAPKREGDTLGSSIGGTAPDDIDTDPWGRKGEGRRS